MELHFDWKEFLSLLMRHGVRFVIVGGHALAANGRPRYTEDLDVFVDRTEANARRLVRALDEFGYPVRRDGWREFTRPNKILFIGRIPLRIDVLTSISGVSFSTAWKGRLVAATDFGALPLLGLAELRINKRASGRTKDLLDLALLDEGATPAATRSRSKRPRPAAPRSRTRGTAARPSQKRKRR
ncbi:MAG: hypothetical protein H0T46_15165 [Deltaproteobacteria bacterium]|nr:hypothetical protein [Deltaproteobacteria bacterium]